MLDRESIKKNVLELAREHIDFGDAAADTDLETMLGDDLGEHLDSIKLFSLVVAIEDHYKICLEPEDDQSITSLEDVVNTIIRLLDQQTADDAQAGS